MDISKYELDQRAQYVAEAKEAAFLDAVFLIHYYNREIKRWWSHEPKPEDITPQEVFDIFDPDAYEDALKRSQKLLATNTLVGMAFFKYQSVSISYEEAIKKFCSENSGFGDKSYGLAAQAGIKAMR